MRRRRTGQGLRRLDEDGQETAARVAWISPLTSRLLIVNRRGVRKMVVSPEELAALVGNGHASVRSVDAPFDEAMKHLWQHPNEVPAAASATCPGRRQGPRPPLPARGTRFQSPARGGAMDSA